MSPGDSELVIKFRALYAKLMDWTDNDPEGLPSLADGDEILRRLCSDLGIAVFLIECEERRDRRLCANPVEPKFVETWRDYEARYASTIACIQITEILDSNAASLDQPAQFSVLSFAERNVESEQERADDKTYEDYLEELERDISKWKILERSGFDVKGIFRRRNLIPFVLIQRYVSTHYNRARRLPHALRRDDLHGLRDLANSILHPHKETLGKLDSLADLDRVIVRYLFTLRLLIEFAPPPTTAAVRRFPNPQSR